MIKEEADNLVLQIKRGNRDNLWMIIHFSPLEYISDPPLEPSRSDEK